jgi:endonuclease-3
MGARREAARVRTSLIQSFGLPKRPDEDPVEMLVRTILSQNTTDTNRDRAYDSLISRFAGLEPVAQADEEEIAETIRVGGLHHQKARTIRAALRAILAEKGKLDLSFLAARSTTEALAWLRAIPGVGAKTAGIVMLFGFDRPFFPVDTHIRRVLTRVGWIAPREDPHAVLNRKLPPDAELMADLHLLLIHLGRILCHPRAPECDRCPIARDCRSGTKQEKERK